MKDFIQVHSENYDPSHDEQTFRPHLIRVSDIEDVYENIEGSTIIAFSERDNISVEESVETVGHLIFLVETYNAR